MKETILGNHIRKVPSVAVGCMRLSEKSKDEMNHFIHAALEQGAYFFDHADIYGGGMSESVFGEAFADDPSIKREDIYLQSKCGIRQGFYDLSKEHILKSVDGILKRLHTDYLDLLLLHRPDALVEPEEVAAAFDVKQPCLTHEDLILLHTVIHLLEVIQKCTIFILCIYFISSYCKK